MKTTSKWSWCYLPAVFWSLTSASKYSSLVWKTDWSNRLLVTKGTPCLTFYTSCCRWKRIYINISMAWLQTPLFPLNAVYETLKHSVCVWPLHTTLPILQCDETFVLAWIETLFSYLMLWYKKMFFMQKTLHLCLSLIFTSKLHTCKCF